MFLDIDDRTRGSLHQAGFSLPELMFVVAIAAILAGMAVPISSAFISRAKADSASILAMSAIESARSRAIAERRNFQLTFVAPDRIRIERVEVPGPAITVVSETRLEGGQTFKKVTDIPDTPDKFGNANPVQFSGTLPVMFTTDGSLVDSNGDVVNGTVFLAAGDHPDSIRAVTILGVTGLIRTWKWSGTQWLE
jgi:prepilin-type N-terminal cleavage/methylation domain-containing protein